MPPPFSKQHPKNKRDIMRVNYVMFDVTDHCNFSCKHCYKNQPDNYVDLDVDKIIWFVDEFQKRGEYPGVVISGGEPLLYGPLYAMLDHICDGRSVRVNTNGIALDRHCGRLMKYKNLRVQVSLDGYDDDTFYQVRNNHAFERIVENTKMAFDKGLDVYFRATLTSRTLDQYERFIAVSKKTGVPIVIRPMYNTGEPEQQELKIEFEDLCKWQEQVIQKGQIEYTGGRNLISESSCPILHRDLIYSTLTVDNHGCVYPCQLLRSDLFYMGNITTDSFETLFSDNERIVTALRQIVESENCRKCGFRNNFGNGTCVPACYIGNKKCIKNKIMGY